MLAVSRYTREYNFIYVRKGNAVFPMLVIRKFTNTGRPRRNVPDFDRVFLMLKYDITQNTYIQN